MSNNICTSTSNWCDECKQYFSRAKPGVVFKTQHGPFRLCHNCLASNAQACEQAAVPDIPEGRK